MANVIFIQITLFLNCFLYFELSDTKDRAQKTCFTSVEDGGTSTATILSFTPESHVHSYSIAMHTDPMAKSPLRLRIITSY